MNNNKRFVGIRKVLSAFAITAICASALLTTGLAVYADDPTNMAPPVANNAPESVFNWSEVPANQQVIITRAVFDQGGYQLYDTQGETIVAPFTNQNLYVMKFAPSDTDQMYFINDGTTPILYVPRNGYLENATTPGARWYPFGEHFHPDHPVFLGIAPSWSLFIGMGWYPHMHYYGGYWSRHPYISGSVFFPSVGLFFEIGGHPYYGWEGYHHYYVGHPHYYHMTYYRRNVYTWAGRSHGPDHRFGGWHGDHNTYRPGPRPGPGGGHNFTGNTGHNFGGNTNHSFAGNTGHRFGGNTNHTFTGNTGHNFGGNHSFSGATTGNNGRGHSFGGATTGNGGNHSFGGGGSHSFGGATTGNGGNHSFGGGGSHSFGGGGSHSFGGGGHSFGGSHANNKGGDRKKDRH
jgi:uncharacterized membrane protein YgcG